MHTIVLLDLDPDARSLRIEGEEAVHALRVKRLASGDPVLVHNGSGIVARCRVASGGRELVLDVIETRSVPRQHPRVEVWSATPKGPRVADLIDALSQAGADSWTPMSTKLGVVDPGAGKLERLERVAHEAMKQCGRAWTLVLHEKSTFAHALNAPPGHAIILADASGQPPAPTGAEHVRLLIGPEGGFRPEEISAALAAGARVMSFGPHAMRIELAAPVAVGIILALEHSNRPPATGQQSSS